MRVFVASGFVILMLAPSADAEKAPLSTDELLEQARFVVVGTIERLRIETEHSRIEKAAGNWDWAIYLTISVDGVEKGELEGDTIEARCFRIKSRKSIAEYVSFSGHHPIPEVGSKVRVYLDGSPGAWDAIIPNGIESSDPSIDLADAQQVQQLHSRGFTYLLPLEIWWLAVGLVSMALVVTIFVRWRSRKSLLNSVSHD